MSNMDMDSVFAQVMYIISTLILNFSFLTLNS